MKWEQLYDEGDEGNGIYDDHQEISEKEEEEAAGGFAGPHGALHPSVEEENGYQRRYDDQPDEQGACLHDVTISLAFSSAAAVGFSPLSMRAMAVIRSSWSSRRIFVWMLSPFTSL